MNREQPRIGRGGNITFTPGRGEPDGSIIFLLANGTEVLRFDHNGKTFVRGNEIAEADDDAIVYVAFRSWLRTAIRGEDMRPDTPPEPD